MSKALDTITTKKIFNPIARMEFFKWTVLLNAIVYFVSIAISKGEMPKTILAAEGTVLLKLPLLMLAIIIAGALLVYKRSKDFTSKKVSLTISILFILCSLYSLMGLIYFSLHSGNIEGVTNGFKLFVITLFAVAAIHLTMIFKPGKLLPAKTINN